MAGNPAAPCAAFAFAFALGVAASLPAVAMDIASAKVPVELADGAVSSGQRTLVLPPGNWTLVDHQESLASNGHGASAPADAVYLVQVDADNRLVLGLHVELLRADIPTNFWRAFPCSGTEDIYLRDRAGQSVFSDCLRVIGQRKGGSNTMGLAQTFSKRALNWLDEHNVKTPDFTVAILYARYASNTFGSVDVIVPSERFESQDATVAWAESLRSTLKPLFEHRTSKAMFPALAATPPPAN
jgi:hypothetical protein